jgi:hypothetical protein
MTEREQIYELRMGLAIAVGWLNHFKGDADCKVPSYPDTIQKAIDEIEGIRRGGTITPSLQPAVVKEPSLV